MSAKIWLKQTAHAVLLTKLTFFLTLVFYPLRKPLDNGSGNVVYNREQVITNHEFISKFELNTLIDMIFKCHPSELHDFRRILLAIYGDATKGSFLDVDSIFMEDLKGKLEKALADQSSHLDRILKLQVEYLIDDLTKFIE